MRLHHNYNGAAPEGGCLSPWLPSVLLATACGRRMCNGSAHQAADIPCGCQAQTHLVSAWAAVQGVGACHVEWQPKFVVINHAIWQRAFGLMRSLFHSLTHSVSFSLQTPQLTATQQGPLCGAPRINKQEQEVEAKARAEEAGERRRRSRRRREAKAKADEVEAAVSE